MSNYPWSVSDIKDFLNACINLVASPYESTKYSQLEKQIDFVEYLQKILKSGEVEKDHTTDYNFVLSQINYILLRSGVRTVCVSSPGEAGFDIAVWMPNFVLVQFRRYSEQMCLLIENVPPADSTKYDVNVENGIITIWYSRSRLGKNLLIMKHCDGSRELNKIDETNRYKLSFNGQNVAYMCENDAYLSDVSSVLLAITFLVGQKSSGRQFLICDKYSLLADQKHRGLSIKSGELYLHGTKNEKNVLKIGKVQVNVWYTALIIYGGYFNGFRSSYILYEYDNLFESGRFIANTNPIIESPLLTVGAVQSKDGGAENFFRGGISNIEISHSPEKIQFPTKILNLIRIAHQIPDPRPTSLLCNKCGK